MSTEWKQVHEWCLLGNPRRIYERQISPLPLESLQWGFALPSEDPVCMCVYVWIKVCVCNTSGFDGTRVLNPGPRVYVCVNRSFEKTRVLNPGPRVYVFVCVKKSVCYSELWRTPCVYVCVCMCAENCVFVSGKKCVYVISGFDGFRRQQPKFWRTPCVCGLRRTPCVESWR